MAHITIGSTTTIAKYTATASQTAFSIPFEFFDDDDIDVYKQGTLLTKSTHYNIAPVTTYEGGYSGGTMTLTSGATLSDSVVIELNISPVRTTDFPVTGGFNIDTLNTWIDKMIVLFKQTFENIDRKVGRASTDTSTYSLNLPTGVTSTDKSLQLGTGGLVLGPSTTTIEAASTKATEAAASASAAATSATAAASSASTASTSAATFSGASSTTSLAIGTGSKAFTVSAGLGFVAGDWVHATSNANPTVNYMNGPIASYSSTTMTVTVDNIGGSGTLNDWTIRKSGTQGTTGATGSTGSTGPTGPVGVGLAIALG